MDKNEIQTQLIPLLPRTHVSCKFLKKKQIKKWQI